MEKYVILADVACDVSEEIRNFCGAEDYVKGHIHFSNDMDFETTLDWSNISREDFYKALSNKKIEISTAPPSPEELYQQFKSYASQGYKILSMSISSKISSTYGVAVNAANRIKEEFPETEIYCFDSMRMSGAFGLLVMYAHLLRKEGKTFSETIEWLEQNKFRVHQMGPIDDLMFVARRGRLSLGKAVMGSFAGVKPMGDCNDDGYVSVLTKVKGIKKALDITARYVEKVAVDVENQYIIISHSNREEYAQTLRELLEKRINPKGIFVSDVFTGSGPNVGPGMIGVYFLGDKISENHVVEKETISKIVEEVK